MHINKYLLWISSVVIIWSIWWLSAGTLNISNTNFAKWFPVFKTIFFRSEGKDSINGSTNPEGIRLDSTGIYTAVPSGLPGGWWTVLKLNWGSYQIFMDPVQNANFVYDSISTNKFTDNSIVNANFSDLAITNTHIQNNTIDKLKFDPVIVWPTGGTMFITNNVCTTTNAIISVNNGTATCALLPTWAATTLPTCSEWQRPVYSGWSWTCVSILLWWASWDPYRTWLTFTNAFEPNIGNSNNGNVWIWTNNPTSTLTVSWSLEVQLESEEQVYCYATDTWEGLSTYSAAECAWCSTGFTYNPTTLLCEQNSCVGTGGVDGVCGFANWQSYSAAPWKWLCSAGTATAVVWNGPWTWDCLGTNWWANDSCTAYLIGGSWGWASNIYINNLWGSNVTINDIDAWWLPFYTISSWSFPLNIGNQLDGIHNGLWANRMEYEVVTNNTSPRCLYTFINNPAGANNCNPGGFAQQTQWSTGVNFGTIYAPAFNDSDRVDLLMCDWICN